MSDLSINDLGALIAHYAREVSKHGEEFTKTSRSMVWKGMKQSLHNQGHQMLDEFGRLNALVEELSKKIDDLP